MQHLRERGLLEPVREFYGAVLGLDVDASTWRRDIAKGVALPVMLLTVFVPCKYFPGIRTTVGFLPLATISAIFPVSWS